jgi:hypothetical protein
MNDNNENMTPTPDAPPTPTPAPPAPPVSPPDAMEAEYVPPSKSPAAAAVLAFIFPGLGQLYAEAFERALMIFAGFMLLIFGAVTGAVPIALTVLSCIFLWFFGMFDAYREAQLYNLGGIEPEPMKQRAGRGRLMFGVFLFVVGGLILVKNLDLFDLDWLVDWWPVLVVIVGIYLIVGAIREKAESSEPTEDETEY